MRTKKLLMATLARRTRDAVEHVHAGDCEGAGRHIDGAQLALDLMLRHRDKLRVTDAEAAASVARVRKVLTYSLNRCFGPMHG